MNPRIRFVGVVWYCVVRGYGLSTVGIGSSPSLAYRSWLRRACVGRFK